MSLMKKDNETVRHFALSVQQLVKKGWCNENAATINLKNNEIFTKGLPEKRKVLLTKDKLNMYQRYLNHQYLFIHLFDMWIPKTSLMKKYEQMT